MLIYVYIYLYMTITLSWGGFILEEWVGEGGDGEILMEIQAPIPLFPLKWF